MSKHEKNLWHGIDPGAQDALKARDYRSASFAQELSQRGLDPRRGNFPTKGSRAAAPGVLWRICAARRRDSRADWLLAKAMVGCADVRKHGKRFPRASAQRSRKQARGRVVAPLVRRRTGELFATPLR